MTKFQHKNKIDFFLIEFAAYAYHSCYYTSKFFFILWKTTKISVEFFNRCKDLMKIKRTLTPKKLESHIKHKIQNLIVCVVI